MDVDADLAAALDGVGDVDAAEALADALEVLEARRVALALLAAGTGARARERVGGGDEVGEEARRRLLAVVGADGGDDLLVLAVLPGELGADQRVRALDSLCETALPMSWRSAARRACLTSMPSSAAIIPARNAGDSSARFHLFWV